MKKLLLLTTILSSIFTSSFAANPKYLIQIKNHKFSPEVVELKAGESFTLIIENLDSTLEEFESDDLRKEKLVRAGKKVRIPVSGLKAGEYKFYGDFHQKTAKGKIIAN